MRRREYLAATGTAVVGSTLAGCLGDGGNGNSTDEHGTLATRVTDQPGDIGDFESCVVTITEIRLKPASDDSDDDGEDDSDDDSDDEGTQEATDTSEGTATESDDEETDEGEDEDEESDDEDSENEESDDEEVYDIDDAEADLVQLQDGNTQLVDEREIETGDYEYMKLAVDGVDATLDGGGDATVETPGNAPLKFNAAFEIRADTRTVFTADFTPVKRGQSGSYLLQPVADGVEVTYEETGGDTEESTDSGTDESDDTDTDTEESDDNDTDEPTEE